MKKHYYSSKALVVSTAISFLLLTGILSSCNVSTANLSDVKVCTSLNGSECSGDASTFSADATAIYCSASLNNAPANTKVTFEWKHEGESMGKAEIEAPSGFVNSTFKPTTELVPGKYSVTVKLATDNSKPITKEFTIN